MRLVATASDVGFFSGVARSPRRLAVVALVLGLVSLAYAFGLRWWMTGSSGSVVVNQLLITAQFALFLVAGYAQALMIAIRLFGDAWRRHVLVGEAVGDDHGDTIGDTASATRDRTSGVVLLVFACTALNYGAMRVATDDYVGYYYRHGFYVSWLRSEVATDRIEALRQIASPFTIGAAEDQAVIDAIVRTVGDPDPEVAAWAAWTVGIEFLPSGRDALLTAFSSPSPTLREQAALALGRLGDLRGERAMVDAVTTSSDAATLRAALIGLGVMGSPDGAQATAARLAAFPPELLPLAVWSAGRARTTAIREQALAFWQGAADDATRCAAAELLKHATTIDDYDAMRTALAEADPAVICADFEYVDRMFQDDVRGEKFKLVVGEPLAAKYMVAAFNIGGDNLRDWLEAIAYDERYAIEMRRLAFLLFEEMGTMRSRPPRR
jgi:hypothetical protein